jgi:hypothetical protein
VVSATKRNALPLLVGLALCATPYLAIEVLAWLVRHLVACQT